MWSTSMLICGVGGAEKGEMPAPSRGARRLTLVSAHCGTRSQGGHDVRSKSVHPFNRFIFYNHSNCPDQPIPPERTPRPQFGGRLTIRHRNVIPKRRAGVNLSGPIDPATGIAPEFLEVSDPAGRP